MACLLAGVLPSPQFGHFLFRVGVVTEVDATEVDEIGRWGVTRCSEKPLATPELRMHEINVSSTSFVCCFKHITFWKLENIWYK